MKLFRLFFFFFLNWPFRYLNGVFCYYVDIATLGALSFAVNGTKTLNRRHWSLPTFGCTCNFQCLERSWTIYLILGHCAWVTHHVKWGLICCQYVDNVLSVFHYGEIFRRKDLNWTEGCKMTQEKLAVGMSFPKGVSIWSYHCCVLFNVSAAKS